MTEYYIGIDGGGSKTHAVLVDHTGKFIAESYAGSANINSDLNLAYSSIMHAINELILPRKINTQEVNLGIGVAGYSVIEKRQSLLNLLNNFKQVKLESDCHIACLAAHGNKDGAIIICGTGIVAYFIQNKKSGQIGGWGFPHGDLGGGAWLGLEACKLVCKAIDKVIPWSLLLSEIYDFFDNDSAKYKNWLLNAKQSNFVEISKFVLKNISNDPVAEMIYSQGLKEVRDFIWAVMQKVEDLPIKLMGGLAIIYIDKLASEFKNLSLSAQKPVVGAIYLYNIDYSY